MTKKKIATVGLASLMLISTTACGNKEGTPADFGGVVKQEKNEDEKGIRATYMSVWDYIGKKGVNNIYPKDFKEFENVQKKHDEDKGIYRYKYKLEDGELYITVTEDFDGDKKVSELAIYKMNDGILDDGFYFIKDTDNKKYEADEEDDSNVIKDTNDGDKEAIKDKEDEENTKDGDEKHEDEKEEKPEKKEEVDTEKEKPKDKKDKDKDKKEEPKQEKPAEEAEEITLENAPKEYKDALKKAEDYVKMIHMSKKRLRDQLISKHGEGYPEKVADFAIENLKVDWKENALIKAKSYKDDMEMPVEKIKEQLMSEYGDGFTEEEADYALKNINKE